jgi:hypothetical protein
MRVTSLRTSRVPSDDSTELHQDGRVEFGPELPGMDSFPGVGVTVAVLD